ncbi:hypothetical protein GCM10009532_13190 [Microbacterium aurantiacum]
MAMDSPSDPCATPALAGIIVAVRMGRGKSRRRTRPVADLRVARPIGEDLAEDLDGEGVRDHHAIEIREQLRRGEPPVRGEDRMRPRPPDRERRPLEVADTALEDVFGGAVINRQVHVDRRDAHACHESVVIGGEQIVVPRTGLVGLRDALVGVEERPPR